MIELASLPPKAKWLGVALMAIGCLWIALDTRSCIGQRQADAAVQQADQHHQAAQVASAQGAAHDQEAQAREQQLQDAAQEVARLKARLARLQAAQPAPLSPPDPSPAVVAGPDNPGGGPGVQPPDDPEKALLRELTAAQDRQIQGLTLQLQTMTLARDGWRTSAQASAQEALQLRAALAASQGAAKGQRLLGRLEGLGLGLGLGYAAGRIH